MPFPLIFWALGAAVTGLAAGKGAELVGNQKVRDAGILKDSADEYLEERKNDYLELHRSGMQWVLEKVSGLKEAVSKVPGVREDVDLPVELMNFMERVCAPWGGSFSGKSSQEVFAFQLSEINAVRSSYLGTRSLSGGNVNTAGIAAAATFGFIYAKRGITYALDAETNFDRIHQWAKETTAAADVMIEDTQADYEQIGLDFDETIIPILEKAYYADPKDIETLSSLATMSVMIGNSAKKKLDELAELVRQHEVG